MSKYVLVYYGSHFQSIRIKKINLYFTRSQITDDVNFKLVHSLVHKTGMLNQSPVVFLLHGCSSNLIS